MKTQENEAKVVWVKRVEKGLGAVDMFSIKVGEHIRLQDSYVVRIWDVAYVKESRLDGRFVCYNADGNQLVVIWNARGRVKEDELDESVYGRFTD